MIDKAVEARLAALPPASKRSDAQTYARLQIEQARNAQARHSVCAMHRSGVDLVEIAGLRRAPQHDDGSCRLGCFVGHNALMASILGAPSVESGLSPQMRSAIREATEALLGPEESIGPAWLKTLPEFGGRPSEGAS